jgi:hypothetical protein
MAQFYLLSIVSNVLTGLALSGDYLGSRLPFLAAFRSWLGHRGAAIALGVVTAVVGVFKLIILSPGERVPVAGDLLPALAGIALGVSLFFEATLRKPSPVESKVDRYAKAVLSYRVPLGLAGLAVALLHFLFPGAVIL